MTLDYYLSSPYEGHSSLLGQEHSTNVDVHHHLTPSLVGLSSTNHELMRSAYQHTSSPMVTGTSVVALKYKDGIMMATDCLASYGSLARFRNVQRMVQVGASTVIGVSGEVSDFQYLQHVLLHHVIEDHEHQDGHVWQPSHLHTYLHRLMYQRRSQMKFLLNTVVVAGLDHGQSYLAAVDFRGVTYSGSSVATGFGAHLAQPILRNALNGGGGGGSPGMEEGRELTLTETEASDLLDQVMRVLYYRDARSLNRIQKAIVSRSLGVVLSKPFSLSTDWQFAEKVRGYGSVKE